MKRSVMVIAVLLLTILLTACSDSPFDAPSGTEFVESDTITFTRYNYNTQEEEVVYTFSFLDEYVYFNILGTFQGS